MKLKHKEILEEYEHNWQGDASNRSEALDDLKNLSGIGQWDSAELQRRELEERPTLTVNLLPQFVRQISNDIKQMRPGVNTIAVDGETDPIISEIFDGLIRQIEYQSNAGIAYGHGGAMSVACGIGHWRIVTENVEDAVFDQEIKIKRILDPLSVVWDSAAVEIDRDDAMNCHVTATIPKHEFERRFKNAKREGNDFPSERDYSWSDSYWTLGDQVRIAERFYKVPYQRHLIMTADGTTHDITELSDLDKANRVFSHGGPLEVEGRIAERKVDSHKIMHVTLDGLDFLDDPKEWAGRHIPIVPCVGDEFAFEGKVYRSGLVRFMKDPQKAYNFWRSTSMEVIAATPRAPWLVEENQIKGWESLWRNANRSNIPFLVYNQDPENPAIKPTRERPPDPPSALWQESQISRDEMKGVTGLYDASLGASSNETSGVAIHAREKQGDTGSYHFIENFNAAIARTGKILVDLIPKIYDSPRVVRLIGKDEKESFAQINQEPVPGIRMNDLSAARFDVRVKTGPSYATARTEAKEQMVEMLRSNPSLWSVMGDLIFKTLDFEGSEEIAERLKKAMPPELVGDDENSPPPQPDPMAIMAQRLGIAKEEVAIALERAKVEKTEAETKNIEAETAKEMVEIGTLAAQV